jgi:hypothetical protein
MFRSRIRGPCGTVFVAPAFQLQGVNRMKNILSVAPLIAATLLLAFGLVLSPDASARAEGIGRYLYGIECDDSLEGYGFDDGSYLYYCDGRQWYIVGTL